MRQASWRPWILVLVGLVAQLVWVEAAHTEELHMRPLPPRGGKAKVLAHFALKTEETTSAGQLRHDSLIPLVVRQVLTKFDVQSLHLTFAVGRYASEWYGPPRVAGEIDEHLIAPYGVHLQVRFGGNTSSVNAMEQWKGVTSELGGVFSASLNQMDKTAVITLLPGSSASEFAPYEAGREQTTPAGFIFLQASLAREELCTENLSPWLKMLPCRTHEGLGSLINPIQVLSGEYLSLSVFVARSKTDWTFHQRLTTVQSIGRSSSEENNWSLQTLFAPDKATLLKACPLADQSFILTEMGATEATMPAANQMDQDRNPARTNLADGVDVSTAWLTPPITYDSASVKQIAPDAVAVHRFLTGQGQVHGGIAVRFENKHATCPARVIYVESSPWYIRMFFHTFKSQRLSLEDGTRQAQHEELDLVFRPAELRGLPNQYRVEFLLPPRSVVDFSAQFEKTFIRLSEHPPDANRGFDLPSGVATFQFVNATQTGSREHCAMPLHTRFTEPLLVALPTPDFSMPYNVITLTSTIVAFFVGSMLNMLLRKAPRIQRMLAESDEAESNSK